DMGVKRRVCAEQVRDIVRTVDLWVIEEAGYPWPMHSYQRASFYNASIGQSLEFQSRLLRESVKVYLDDMQHSGGFHFHSTVLAVGHVGGRPGALERVTELPSGWTDIVRLVRDAHGVIERSLQNGDRQSRTVVRHGHGVVVNDDPHHRC